MAPVDMTNGQVLRAIEALLDLADEMEADQSWMAECAGQIRERANFIRDNLIFCEEVLDGEGEAYDGAEDDTDGDARPGE